MGSAKSGIWLHLQVLAILLALVGPAAAQPLGQREQAVLATLVELWHRRFYDVGKPLGDTKEGLQPLYAAVASQHGLSSDQVRGLADYVLDGGDFTAKEEEAFEDLCAELDKLPKGASVADQERAHAAVAKRNGLTVEHLHRVEFIIIEGDW